MPLTHVEETVGLDPRSVSEADGTTSMIFRGGVVPLVNLRALVGLEQVSAAHRPVIMLRFGDRRSGLVVDRIAGQREIVVKAFAAPRGTLPVFSGATILGDGRVVLILDAVRLV